MTDFDKIERVVAFFGYGEHHTLSIDDSRDISESMRLLLDVARAAERVDKGHWFAEGGYIPESDWIALMNTVNALREHCDG